MKTAKELIKALRARDDWKTLKLCRWAFDYEAKAQLWNNIFPPVHDDRRLYINMYKQVYEAVDSLPDNPCSWVCSAVSHKLSEEREIMDNILAKFK